MPQSLNLNCYLTFYAFVALAAPSYTEACDIWSVGVVVYVLLCGYPPFNAGNEKLTYDLVTEGLVKFPSPDWDDTSPEAINFIRSLLQIDPARRPSASDALKDPWLTQEKVQPEGVDKRASFLPTSDPSTAGVSLKKQVRHNTERAGPFRRFMQRIKHGKETAHHHSHHP